MEISVALVPLRFENVMVEPRDTLRQTSALLHHEHSQTKRRCPARLDHPGASRLHHARESGTSGVNSDHNLTQIFETRKESARLDLELAIVARETPGLAAAIRALELSDDRARREAVCCEPLGSAPLVPALAGPR